jgi:hypothetical protein
MVTNADRAAWAEEAVQAFQAVCPTDDDDAVKDLIVDLCHLERRRRAERGEEFDASGFLEARAMMHDAEVDEDPEDEDADQ